MSSRVTRGAPDGVLFHGTSPLLVEYIAASGLRPRHGYVHLSLTEGLAYAYGAWVAGLTISAGYTKPVPSAAATMRAPMRVATVRPYVKAALNKGPEVAAVAVVDTGGLELEDDPQSACPALPWESRARQAPCWRYAAAISADRILEWRVFRIPELTDPEVLSRMADGATALAHDYPRGEPLLEDLSPYPVSREIPNGRRLLAAIFDAQDGSAGSAHHGPAHWAAVAAHGLDLQPGADLPIVLLFALLHDAARKQEGRDPNHGQRAAELARQLNGDAFDLSEKRLDLLAEACARHVDGDVSTDPTIGACWDADRLDLARFGTAVAPEMMSTDAGRSRCSSGGDGTFDVAMEAVLDSYRARLS